MLSHTGSAFFALMLKGTHRVAHLCKAPQLLACWALELLEEQAVNVSLHPPHHCLTHYWICR